MRITAILITHQLEEAIGVGDRIVVFGQVGEAAGRHSRGEMAEGANTALREAIQSTLQRNRRDPRLDRSI